MKNIKLGIIAVLSASLLMMFAVACSSDDSTSAQAAAPAAPAEAQGAPSAQQQPAAATGQTVAAQAPVKAVAPSAPQAAAQVQATAVAQTKAAGGTKGVGAGAIQLKAPAIKAVALARFNESPMLAALVTAGSLPSVDKRLPSDPLVIEVFDEIGIYGGTMRRVFTGARDTCNYTRLARSGLTRWSHDGFEARGNIAASWEADPQGKVWTVTLRDGMHWSDGEPIDADDFVYAYEFMGRIDPFNDELRGSPPAWMRSGSPYSFSPYHFNGVIPVILVLISLRSSIRGIGDGITQQSLTPI